RRSEMTGGLLVRFNELENTLLTWLRNEKGITVQEFRKMAGIKSRVAEKIISDFVLCGLITAGVNEKGIYYRLTDEFESAK
ncbi:MAG: hypothetical protein QUS12_10345, partial [Methanosarcina sp.]|nr:hypothetical protein [Methanosarcina sp.]